MKTKLLMFIKRFFLPASSKFYKGVYEVPLTHKNSENFYGGSLNIDEVLKDENNPVFKHFYEISERGK
mgnify:CR=1 FL=1